LEQSLIQLFLIGDGRIHYLRVYDQFVLTMIFSLLFSQKFKNSVQMTPWAV